MASDNAFVPPKKKLNIIWWVGGAILLLVCLFLFQLIGPSPPIIISKQTTYITDPLLPSGVPNYEEYLHRKLREGVTPENNAAVLLFEALWPSELDPSQHQAVIRELGLKDIPSTELAMKSPHGEANRKRVAAWLPQPSQDDIDRGIIEADADAVIDAALNHPWTSEQIPPLAAWVKENETPLDLIVEASHRPRYYSPSPTLLDDRHDMLISVLLPGVQAVRDGVRGLNLRAMQHIGENRPDKAWQDILAMYRLASLIAQGSTLVEQLVAIAIRGIAFQATNALLSRDQLPKELAQQIRKDLDAIPPLANVATCVDQMERFSGLDAIIHLKLYGISQLSALDGGSAERSPIDFLSVDWNVALKKLNQAYDEGAAAMKLPPGDEREQALHRFAANLDSDANSVKQPGRLIPAIISRGARSDVAGSIIQALMLPALEAAIAAEDRTNSMLSLAQVAAALAVYRAEHGAYPEKLEELVPGTLAKVPVDLFHGKPLVYKRVDQGYLLYSLGLNAQDDGGSNSRMNTFQGKSLENLDPSEVEKLRAKIPDGADDFSIRLPISPFEMPKPRTE